jgi:hypothetical protein
MVPKYFSYFFILKVIVRIRNYAGREDVFDLVIYKK